MKRILPRCIITGELCGVSSRHCNCAHCSNYRETHDRRAWMGRHAELAFNAYRRARMLARVNARCDAEIVTWAELPQTERLAFEAAAEAIAEQVLWEERD